MPRHSLTLPLPSLADYITWHRQRLGLTRKALGTRAFVAEGTIRKLETGELKKVGDKVLESLATALELQSPDQRRHLSELTRVDIPRPWIPSEFRPDLSAEELAALSDLMPQPAAYHNERWDVIAANDAYEQLFPGIRSAGNVLLWLFSAGGRAQMIDWTAEVTGIVAKTRGFMAHFGNPDWAVQLVTELQDDPDFARLWLEREVEYDRSLDTPMHVWTADGPRTVAMQFRPLTERPDLLHMAIAFPRPYRGPAELLAVDRETGK